MVHFFCDTPVSVYPECFCVFFLKKIPLSSGMLRKNGAQRLFLPNFDAYQHDHLCTPAQKKRSFTCF